MERLFATIKDGKISHIAVADSKLKSGWVEVTGQGVGIGWDAIFSEEIGYSFLAPVVVEAPVVPVIRKMLTIREFKSLFTPTEYRLISDATSTDDVVFQFWDIAQTSLTVDLEFPQTLAGLQYLVNPVAPTGQLITQTRYDEITEGITE